MSKEALAYAYREAGKAVAAHVLGDDAITLDSNDPAIKSRANEIEATIALAGPYSHLQHDPAIDAELAWKREWAADEFYAYSRTTDAVLWKFRPDEPWPEAQGGVIMLDVEEAVEARALMNRLRDVAKALVADRWFAISTLATTLFERGSVSPDDVKAIVRTHPAGSKAN